MIRRKNLNRNGSVLIAVLVCLGVATTILLATVQISLLQHRQLRKELQMEQTRWLLDAGISRAVASLKKEPNYDGETLMVDSKLRKYHIAIVVIEINPDGEVNEPVEVPSEKLEKLTRVRVSASLERAGEVGSRMKRSTVFLLGVD